MSSFMKKKQDNRKSQKKSYKTIRMDTETGNPLLAPKPYTSTKQHHQQKRQNQTEKQPQKTYKIERCVTTGPVNESAVTVFKAAKTTLSIKQLTKTMWQLKNLLDVEYEEMLTGKVEGHKYKQINQLLYSNYFRFRKTTYLTALDQYSNVIQALELLISKLTNNEKLTEKVLIRNQQDFVLFFKFFFSKPYTLINRPAVRKVIKLLWDQFTFPSLTVQAMLRNLRLWIFGISSPLNPSMNKLHKMCSQLNEEISRLVNHKSNQHVYIGVNDSDTLCLTPLMVAVIAGNRRGIEKLIKNGADLHCCPLTVNSKLVTESVESLKSGSKVMLKKEFGIKQRKQPDPIEYLKMYKKNDEIAQMLCWQNFYELKKLRKDSELSDVLEMFPNCCFQFDWKQYRGMLCFKQLPQDIISVYKSEHSIRIDYHLQCGGGQTTRNRGHYSLIFTAKPKNQNTFFMINHTDRLIQNLFEDKDIKSIKEKYNTLLKIGNAYNTSISDMKAIFLPQSNRLSSTFQTYYQNYIKAPHLPHFESQNEYFKAVVDAQLINYAQLQKNQIKAIINQSVVRVDKTKGKFVQSQLSIDVQWAQQQLNLTHIKLILKLVQVAMPQSTFFSKMATLLQCFDDPIFRPFNFLKKLPIRCKLGGQQQNSIQCDIKNLRYCKLQESIFKLQVKAKQLKFQEIDEPVDVSHLQDTMYVDEMYSIRASRFMGNSQAMLQLEDQEANTKFQELLRLEGIWSNDEEEQK